MILRRFRAWRRLRRIVRSAEREANRYHRVGGEWCLPPTEDSYRGGPSLETRARTRSKVEEARVAYDRAFGAR